MKSLLEVVDPFRETLSRSRAVDLAAMVQALCRLYAAIPIWSPLWLKSPLGFCLSSEGRLTHSHKFWLPVRSSASWCCISTRPYPFPSACPALLQLRSQRLSAREKRALHDRPWFLYIWVDEYLFLTSHILHCIHYIYEYARIICTMHILTDY